MCAKRRNGLGFYCLVSPSQSSFPASCPSFSRDLQYSTVLLGLLRHPGMWKGLYLLESSSGSGILVGKHLSDTFSFAFLGWAV